VLGGLGLKHSELELMLLKIHPKYISPLLRKLKVGYGQRIVLKLGEVDVSRILGKGFPTITDLKFSSAHPTHRTVQGIVSYNHYPRRKAKPYSGTCYSARYSSTQ
jgi:hypothetical protein